MDAVSVAHGTTLVLSLTESGAEQLGHAPEFQPPRASPPTTQHFLSRYYDTASFDLAHAPQEVSEGRLHSAQSFPGMVVSHALYV